MATFIAIDGPTAIGKTYRAKQLITDPDSGFYLHHDKASNAAGWPLARTLVSGSFELPRDFTVVFDRWYLSPCVYETETLIDARLKAMDFSHLSMTRILLLPEDSIRGYEMWRRLRVHQSLWKTTTGMQGLDPYAECTRWHRLAAEPRLEQMRWSVEYISADVLENRANVLDARLAARSRLMDEYHLAYSTMPESTRGAIEMAARDRTYNVPCEHMDILTRPRTSEQKI